jgi:hypothetical protein
MTGAQRLDLRNETVHRPRKRGTEVTAFTARNQVALPGSMENNFHSFHGSILLKADNAVNCARHSAGGPPHC